MPWSEAIPRATLHVPPGATDCHHHIYHHGFPNAPGATVTHGDATVAQYRALQARLGITRNVIVQPSAYGTDNRCTLEAMAELGPSCRAVAVVDPTITDAQLMRMHEAGVRGIRFNLVQTGATTKDMLVPLAARVHTLGWHVQFNIRPATLMEVADVLARLPCPVVFDHLARVPQPEGLAHPSFALVRRMLDAGRTWVKLSGAYLDTRVGPPGYDDVSVVARAYAAAAPERCVWGSDWPHPTAQGAPPDDALLLDLLEPWVPDPAARRRVLVDNPAALYDFPAA